MRLHLSRIRPRGERAIEAADQRVGARARSRSSPRRHRSVGADIVAGESAAPRALRFRSWWILIRVALQSPRDDQAYFSGTAVVNFSSSILMNEVTSLKSNRVINCL